MHKDCINKGKKGKNSCSCDLSLRFCSQHFILHSGTPGVHKNILISERIEKLKSKAAIALENLEENQDKVLTVGKLMTAEILTRVQETMMLLESRKIEIIDLLKSRQFGKEVESKIEEITQIKFQKRGGFQESVEKYLNLYEDYENSIFKEEIIKIHKSVEEGNAIFKEINKTRLRESQNFEKRFELLENKMNDNIKIINETISQLQNKIGEKIEIEKKNIYENITKISSSIYVSNSFIEMISTILSEGGFYYFPSIKITPDNQNFILRDIQTDGYYYSVSNIYKGKYY